MKSGWYQKCDLKIKDQKKAGKSMDCTWKERHKSSWKHHESESVTQSCPILCDPTDCSLQGSSVHGILQARILVVRCHALFQGIKLTGKSSNTATMFSLVFQNLRNYDKDLYIKTVFKMSLPFLSKLSSLRMQTSAKNLVTSFKYRTVVLFSLMMAMDSLS